MKTSVQIQTVVIPATTGVNHCLCGADYRGHTCPDCGHFTQDEKINFEVGTVWEVVETKHGSARFSYAAEDHEMRLRRLHGALRRIVGYTVTTGWGHYGKSCPTGGLNVHGKFETRRI